MANMEGLRAADMRESNEKLIKKFLMEYGECTKMDIAGGLGLSHPTVAKALADMVGRGEAESAGKEDSLGGRSGEKYRLNYNNSHILAVILTVDKITYRVANLARKTMEEGTLPVKGETHIARIAELVSDVRGRFPIRLIEVGMSGNVLNGRLMYISKADSYLLGVDVAGELGKRCQLPVEVVNDVNAMAFGFFRQHIEVSLKNESMAYLIENRTGPGAGIIVDGKLVNGFSGFAGEIANVWPPQESLTDQIKSQVAAIISVVNPRYLVVGHDPSIQIDRAAVRTFVEAQFPAHSVPRFHFAQEFPTGSMPELHFTTELEENYMEGLTELAIDGIFPG